MNFRVKSIEKKETTCPIYFIFSPNHQKSPPPRNGKNSGKTSMSMVAPLPLEFLYGFMNLRAGDS